MSIQDIYGRSIEFGGAFSADSALLTFGGAGGTSDLLVVQAQWSYPQTVGVKRSLSSNMAYLYAAPSGEQGGQLQIARIIGPVGFSTDFLSTFGNVCSTNNNLSLSMITGCGDQLNNTETVTLHHAVLSNVGGQMTVQDFMVMQNLTLTFFAMSIN